ncbi:hypothetical protein [Pseudoprimorskyibacter insulae]|uniref:Tetratricopeptide repeat-like domain-containing protein n=1 Tax=Pseudoprimorskyibacter insulae TaxID=1695997 RepID=A0A2R8AXY5_9RHOB|nr:hypothetical protein [Pseudoprimorskyibacter insulae]SPF80886.1 hypothetical protein PRI8871_02699 [Pseudoprimorskyibacter insulae]
MSDTDSFIDEVTEEVRRDRLFQKLRKYGWIGGVVVLVIVGGTAWREYSQARDAAAAQAFGDSILDALTGKEPQERIAALDALSAPNAGGQAVLDMLVASEQASNDQNETAVATLRQIAASPDAPKIYRQIANYKALSRAGDALTVDERRIELEALAAPGSALRLLAEEQLALIEIEAGNGEAAITRLQAILADAEVSNGLRRRVTQLIVALGGTPEQG